MCEPSSEEDESPAYGWPTPAMDHAKVFDLDRSEFLLCSKAKELRMNFMECNKPGTDGYSAAIWGARVAKLYSHQNGVTKSMYQDMDQIAEGGKHMIWMHLPVDKGEYLQEIWALRLPGYGFMGLLVSISALAHSNKADT